MAAFNSIKDLCAALQTKIDAELKNEVAPEVKKVLSDKIDENVYGRYSPVVYNRRGALGDVSNMVDELESSGVLSVRDVATPSVSVLGTPYSPPNDTTFPGWVNDGEVPNIFNGNQYPWEEPAHFIEDTREELSDGKIVKGALIRGLKKSGIKAE